MTLSIEAGHRLEGQAATEPASTPILTVRDLHVHFFTYGGVVKAVNGIDLRIQPGEMTALVGESGSGKSVLAWSMLGLTKPPGRVVAGEVLWRGENVLAMSKARLRELRGREMSLIVSNPRSHLHALTRVGHQIENVRVGGSGKRGAREAVLQALKSVEMPDPLRVYNAYPHELSGGMAQRVLIAMALINSPELVIADDATNALDVTVQRQVLDLMSLRIRESGASALMITHDLGIVAQYCKRATIVHGGLVYEEASTEQLFANPQHPYTRSLIAKARRRRSERPVSGEDLGAGRSDGSWSGQDRTGALQGLREVEPGHWVRGAHPGDHADSEVSR